jgi:hypothetical protein
MNHRPIIDAGPGLNFFSINKERLLIGVLGSLSAPETVRDEVFRKARQDERFRAAATVWRKLSPRWMEILSDDQTPELAAVVHRITRQSMAQRLKHSKDLGETMVIAHAVVAAEAGCRAFTNACAGSMTAYLRSRRPTCSHPPTGPENAIPAAGSGILLWPLEEMRDPSRSSHFGGAERRRGRLGLHRGQGHRRDGVLALNGCGPRCAADYTRSSCLDLRTRNGAITVRTT